MRSCRCVSPPRPGGCSWSTGSELLAIAGLAPQGGGRLGLCRLPGAGGDLAADVAAIVAWRPELVVSLTEAAEMAAAAGLPEALAAAGIGWCGLPIPDFGTPEGAGGDGWPELAERLHGMLDGGGAVLLHCRGGIGRSGMIALRLLVERGEAADAALARLRAVRPGAVETAAQLAWATAVSARAPPPAPARPSHAPCRAPGRGRS